MSATASPTSPGSGSSREAVQAKIKCITSPDTEPIEEVHTLVPGGSPVAINIPGTGTIKLSANFLSSEGDDGSEAGAVEGACECQDRADREAAVVSSTLKQIVPLRKMLSRIRKKVECLSTNISGNGAQPPRVDCGNWYGTPPPKPPTQLPISSGPPVGGQSCGRTKEPPAIIEDPPTHILAGPPQNVCQEGPRGHPHSDHHKGGYGHPDSDHHGGTLDQSYSAHHQSSYAHPHSDHHRQIYDQPQSAKTPCQYGHPHSDHHKGGYDQPHTAHHESPYGPPRPEQHSGNFDLNRGNYGHPHSEHHRGGYDHPHHESSYGPPHSARHESPYGHPHTAHHESPYGHPHTAHHESPYGHPHTAHHESPYGHPHSEHHESPYGHPHSEHHKCGYGPPPTAHHQGPYGPPPSEYRPQHYQDAPSECPPPAPPERLCKEPSPAHEGVFTTPYSPTGPYMAASTDPLYCKPPPEINKPNCPPYTPSTPRVVPVDMNSCAKTPCTSCPFRSAAEASSRRYENNYTMKHGTGVDVNIRNDAPPCCVPQLMGRCEPCATMGPQKETTCSPCEYRREPTC